MRTTPQKALLCSKFQGGGWVPFFFKKSCSWGVGGSPIFSPTNTRPPPQKMEPSRQDTGCGREGLLSADCEKFETGRARPAEILDFSPGSTYKSRIHCNLSVDPGFMCGSWTEIQDLCVDPGFICGSWIEIQDLGRPRPALSRPRLAARPTASRGQTFSAAIPSY